MVGALLVFESKNKVKRQNPNVPISALKILVRLTNEPISFGFRMFGLSTLQHSEIRLDGFIYKKFMTLYIAKTV